MKIRKADLAFFVMIPAVVLCLWLLTTEQTTLRIPRDDNHGAMAQIYKTEGKKAAGKACLACHSDETTPLSENHPPKYRCMFCHKFAETGNTAASRAAENRVAPRPEEADAL